MSEEKYELIQGTTYRVNPTFEWLMSKSLAELKEMAAQYDLDAKKWWDKSVYAVELTKLSSKDEESKP